MKKYLNVILFVVVLLILGLFIRQRYLLNKYKNLYNKELQNVEAYRFSNSGLEGVVREYQMTMDDLRRSKDSIDIKLVSVIDKLKLKDKKINYLQYHTSTIYRTDTIQIKDTILTPKAHIDTLIGDKWYSLKLKLDYPSTLVVTPTFSSEMYVVINNKKEYNKTPSKIFFIRWFQKKHLVTEVNVEERNPYIKSKENKFIKINK